ncbi:PilZ domain-containing protein [Thiorhodococcus mannitoliphagus]|uniref:PilZ domain-containing protein n=1 Tax=Thiorhodococcus mannitoliphagus TaxID=329406 RepID=A0A6P1DYC3_9GAMM|nr:PilZ domain-containing protein [Thiorhodococcus mannitoliphagus]NEX23208.1 PilZ domain-containing protein [Thiorhodococcus mannitoliphagus]
MSKELEQNAQDQDQERRRYFRIEDEVGLLVTPISPADEAAAIAGFDDEEGHASLMNELRALRDAHLPQRRSLEYKFPTVAAYMRMVEKQIDLLAAAVGDENGYPAAPDTPVNLSAQGLSYEAQEPLEMDSLVEVRLTIFPDRCGIKALGRIVRCEGDEGCGDTAVEFTHLRDADREAIIRHVHLLQRLRLQANTEKAFE